MHFKKLVSCTLAVSLALPFSALAANEKAEVSSVQGGSKIIVSGTTGTNELINIRVKKPDANEDVYQNQTAADENGNYSFNFVMPSALASGTYPVRITYEDGTNAALTFDYKSSGDVSEAFSALRDVKNTADLLNTVNQYGKAWNFNMDLFSALSDGGKTKALENFLAVSGEKAETPAQAAEIFESAAIGAAATDFGAANFKNLVTGTYKAVTGFADTAVYKTFSAKMTDSVLAEIAQKMQQNTYETADQAKTEFERQCALYIVKTADTWFDVKQALEAASIALNINPAPLSGTNAKEIADFLKGKDFTAFDLKTAYDTAASNAESGGSVIFSDAAEETPWANNSINALYKAGIVSGTGAGLFEPNGNVSREQFAKMIVSMLGDGELYADNPFTDVAANEWYAPFVCTAKAIGVVSGVSDTEFGVEQNITREQMAAMIFRAGKLLGFAPSGRTKSFADESDISDYAKDAVLSLASAGVIGGMPDGTFLPQATATRAEAACMIYILMTKAAYSSDTLGGLEPLTGADTLVSLQENYNDLAEKDYKERDLTSFTGWYFVPNGASYISAAPAPAGKTDFLPATAAQKVKNSKDIAICLSANNSDQNAFFDVQPFQMNYKTAGKQRIEMNAYFSSENKSSEYKVFDTLFMTEANGDDRLEMPLFYVAGDGGLYVYDENGNGVLYGSVAFDRWVHLAMELNPENKTFDLAADGMTLAENVPFTNKDILWDGSSTKSGFKKIRLRFGVVPNETGTSKAYIDDFLWARYTSTPLFVLRDINPSGNEVAILVPENMSEEALKEYVTLKTSGGETVPYTGSLQNGVYTLTLSSPLVSGAEYSVYAKRWLSTGNGTMQSYDLTLRFTAQ